MSDKKVSASRKHHLKSLMLGVAKGLLEAEAKVKADDRIRHMQEVCPPLSLPDTLQELQVLCRELHNKVDAGEEEKYDLERKVQKSEAEIADMRFKIQDLRGKFKRPPLKKVRMSADAMLQALLGSKHKVTMDLRSSLKQVKKEVKEEDKGLRDVGDWRKKLEDKAGMDGRKKMFESEA